ncbi:transposase [Chamaesiphon sp.]|uniref:helix-turn-helix domain-containing protein n=1 Tax=Chamaesiphon sp. TaxID=2814140 RepID=UPI0035933A88
MKPYAVDLREKVVNSYYSGNISVRKLAVSFGVGKAFVQKMLRQYKEEGHVNPGKQGTRKKAVLAGSSALITALVEQYPDATLSEYCEYWLESHKQVVSESMMCRGLQKLNLSRKKKRSGAAKLRQIESSYSDANTGKSEI